MGTSDHPPNLLITSNFLPQHLPLPTQFHHHSQFPTWTPSITLSLSHHFNFHTWAPPITHHISPPLPMSHLGTSNYPPTFLTTSNLTLGHLWSTPHFPHHFQFHTWAHPITHPNLPPPPFHTWAHSITHPISPPLPISQLGASNYQPTFTSTCHFTPGLLQFLTTFLTTSNFTTGHLLLPTLFYHHSQFHTWAHLITHPLSLPLVISHLGSNYSPFLPPLPISHLGTSHYPPNITTPYNFPPGHFWLPTHFHHHFHFHSWAPWITCPPSPPLPISPPPITHLFWQTLPFSHMASFNYLPILTTTSICTALYSWLPIPPNSDVFILATSDYTPPHLATFN